MPSLNGCCLYAITDCEFYNLGQCNHRMMQCPRTGKPVMGDGYDTDAIKAILAHNAKILQTQEQILRKLNELQK